MGEDSLYVKEDKTAYIARKKAILAESKVRLNKLPAYIEKKKWFEVKNELDRYMYETRGAVKGLAKTYDQKEKATEFFKAIEKTNGSATQKKQDECMAAALDSVAKLDSFVSSI